LNQYTWLGFNAGDFCVPSDVSWMSASPLTGTIQPLNNQIVEITLDSSGISPGSYGGQLCIESNDFYRTLVRVPVTLEVGSDLVVLLPLLRK